MSMETAGVKTMGIETMGVETAGVREMGVQEAAPEESGRETFAPSNREGRGPLQRLLHALNQPLTGLQCSMEVALAQPRTAEHYADCLRGGLELTERMRVLVGALRELADISSGAAEDWSGEDCSGEGEDRSGQDWSGEGEDRRGNAKTPDRDSDLCGVLREAVNELKPVAGMRQVRIAGNFSSLPPATAMVRLKRERLSQIMIQVIDVALGDAAGESELRIEVELLSNQVQLRIEWRGETLESPKPESAASESTADFCREFSRAELGWMVAWAGLEQCGASCRRERSVPDRGAYPTETLIIMFPALFPAGFPAGLSARRKP